MRSIDELATGTCTLAGHITAAAHRFLALVDPAMPRTFQRKRSQWVA
jgi:hypothetical protein